MLNFLNKHEPTPELYWSVVLEPGWVQAGVWQILDGSAKVVSSSPPVAWGSDTEFIEAVDASLSTAAQKLPDGSPEPKKTVFGVGLSWMKDGEVESQYLAKIKKVCEELSLSPTGFVVLPEAIAHLYKSLEGAPINAVILGVGSQNLEVSIFSLGNLVGTASVARSVSLADDVIEGLSRFGEVDPLPSRIIVFDGRGGELEEARDTLSAVSWEGQEKIKFLHTPKVEILESDKKVLATSFAGAAEIGQVSKIEVDVEEPTVEPLTSAENLGFVVDKDVSTSFLAGIFEKVKFPKFSFWDRSKFIPLGMVLGIFVVGLIFFWWFYPKATVTIYVSPKKFEEEFEISFDASEVKSVVVSGEKTKSATGIKLVGERARGSVSLRNGTGSPINFSAGTVLFSSGDLRFTLNETASVSAAIDADNPGVAGANITAADIGAAYNLAKDEVFKIGNYPKADAYAKSTNDFSGGSSREISAVSEEDQEKLLEDLKEELSEKSKSELRENVGENQIFIDSFVSFETESQSFSHRIGDEADTVKLDLSMTAKSVITDKKRLADFVRDKLKDKVPQGFVLRDSQIEYKFEFINESSGKYNFKLTSSLNFLPEVEADEIIQKISGRFPEVVEEYLTSIPGFSRAEIRINPHFPGRFGTLPRVGKNITIEIAAEK